MGEEEEEEEEEEEDDEERKRTHFSITGSDKLCSLLSGFFGTFRSILVRFLQFRQHNISRCGKKSRKIKTDDK